MSEFINDEIGAINHRLIGFAVMTYHEQPEHRECLASHMYEHIESYVEDTLRDAKRQIAHLAALAAQMLWVSLEERRVLDERPDDQVQEFLSHLKGIAEQLGDPLTMRLTTEDVVERLTEMLRDQ